jgi:hypothetical protein
MKICTSVFPWISRKNRGAGLTGSKGWNYSHTVVIYTFSIVLESNGEDAS